MIGSGIFIVSAEILREVHSPGLLLVVWALSGVVTLIGALTYGELAAMFPHAGGQYVYLREGISPLFGYLYGWTLFVVIQTGTIAAVAVAFAKFTSVLFPGLSADVFRGWGTTVHFPAPIGDILVGVSPQRLLAIATIVLLTWINVRGVQTAAFIQTSLTVIKTAALAALILLGITVGRNAQAIAANFGGNFWSTGGWVVGAGAVGAAMVGSLFSMDAWNNVGFAGSEMKDATKDLPIAMVFGTLVVTVLYVLANVAYLNVLPRGAIVTAPQDRVGTAALQAIFGAPGLVLMAVAIMISTFGCNNGLILSGARVYYAMARDNLFFKSAGELHPRYHTPSVALVAQAVWTCVLCLSGTYGQLLNFVIFAALLFYMVATVGLFALRVNRPELPRPVKAVAYPWLPSLYIVATGLISLDLLVSPATRTYAFLGLGLVVLGVPVYYVWRSLVTRAA
jgi:APA family basic amino acid/polyamine antiporter